MQEELVQVQVRNRIGYLTLNRPSGLNALTLPMVGLLAKHLSAWQVDPQINAVVLRSTGEKAFCAGGDIRFLYQSHVAGSDEHFAFFAEEYQLDLLIHQYRKPLLALMDGLVLGGGMGLVQGAGFRLISERVRMAMPETAIGFYPDVGGSYFLPRLAGEVGLYLALTGNQVGAADALHYGLADACVAFAGWPQLLQALELLRWSGDAQADIAALVQRFASAPPAGAQLPAQQALIDQCFAASSVEQVMQRLAAHTDNPWAQRTVEVLRSRSPLALLATFALMRRGRKLSLAQCFAQELALAPLWFEQGDLIEGVRALLIDKDNAPMWRVANVQALRGHPIEQWLSRELPH